MAHHEVAREDGVHVLDAMCATCIFRPGNLMQLNPGRLKGMIEKARANESCIPCHSTIHGADVKPAVCRGFFDRYGTLVWTLRFAISQGWIVFDDPPPEDPPPVTHARIPVRTRYLAGGDRSAYAKCRCGWVATWPRTQTEAADAYRAHKRQAADG